jgi:hypothetical protein
MEAREWGSCDKVCKVSSGKREVCEEKGAAHSENVIHECALPWPKFDKLNVVLHSGTEVLRQQPYAQELQRRCQVVALEPKEGHAPHQMPD